MALKLKGLSGRIFGSDWIVFVVLLLQMVNPILLMVTDKNAYRIAVSSFVTLTILFFLGYTKLLIEMRLLRRVVQQYLETPPILKLELHGEEVEIAPRTHSGVRH